jgi:hypothetical protein
MMTWIFIIRIVLYIVVISVLYIVVISIDDKLFKLMFDDNLHICMIYGIEIKSINQSINQGGKVISPMHQLCLHLQVETWT